MILLDATTMWLIGSVLVVMALVTAGGQLLKHQNHPGLNPAVIDHFNSRVRAWWLLCAVLVTAFWIGSWATVAFFGALSFWALREFITLTPTRMADHRTLFWVFFIFTPLQFFLVARNEYGLYSVLIPVYAFLFIPARIALAGDSKRYLERFAKIQAALMICVYCLSYAPAILYLDIPNYNGNARLLFFFILVVSVGDASQYIGERLLGKNVIAPAINGNKTWEGFLFGAGCATLFGTALWWATPFTAWVAALMSLVLTTLGFAGAMTMSAIKRDRGVKDYGTLVVGHGGVLDRIDSLCFAAPIFYHLTKILIQGE